jgi:hypothetical protein
MQDKCSSELVNAFSMQYDWCNFSVNRNTIYRFIIQKICHHPVDSLNLRIYSYTINYTQEG